MNDLHWDVMNLDAMDDRKMVGNLYPHMSDQLGDRKMVVMMDANRGHRKSDPHLDEKNLSAVDASHDLRMNVLHLDVRSLDVMDDRKMDATMDGSRGRHRNGLH
jgi:hypothetical protein